MESDRKAIDLWDKVTVIGIGGKPPKVLVLFPGEQPTSVSGGGIIFVQSFIHSFIHSFISFLWYESA